MLAFSTAIGVGVTVWPCAFQDKRVSPYTAHFWQCSDCSETMKGIRNGISIFLSTGFCCGTMVAMLLNMILPTDMPISYDKKYLINEEISEAEVGEDEEPLPTKNLDAEKDVSSEEDAAPKKIEEDYA